MTGDRKFYFDRCFFFDAKPGYTVIDVGKFDSVSEAKAITLSKTASYMKPGTIDIMKNENSPEEYCNLHPSICIFVYSPEQARAYADVFSHVADTFEHKNDLENKKED